MAGIGIGIKIGSEQRMASFESETMSLLARMEVLGELPTSSQQSNIDLTIKDLKNYCLFTRRFDCFYFMRGYGLGATKLNWIKDAHNLTKEGAGTLTFTDALGYQSNGTSTYLDTNYIPFYQGVNWTSNDVTMFIKLGGTVGTGCCLGGAKASANAFYNFGATAYSALQEASIDTEGTLAVAGYNAKTRIKSTEYKEYRNSNAELVVTANSNIYPLQISPTILTYHDTDGSTFWFQNATAIAEVVALGGYISYAEFLAMQTVINAYISRL